MTCTNNINCANQTLQLASDATEVIATPKEVTAQNQKICHACRKHHLSNLKRLNVHLNKKLTYSALPYTHKNLQTTFLRTTFFLTSAQLTLLTRQFSPMKTDDANRQLM
jgi:hypothetical protein